jgi:hypothetical protein
LPIGALLEAFSKWGRGRPRGRGSRPRVREALASRPPALRPAAIEGLDVAGTKAGGSPPNQGSQWRHPLLPARKHGAGDLKSRMWSAERRRALRKGRARRKAWTKVAPPRAPSPRMLRGAARASGRGYGVPGAAKEYGRRRTRRDKWLFDNRIGKGRSARHSHFPSPLVGEGARAEAKPSEGG